MHMGVIRKVRIAKTAQNVHNIRVVCDESLVFHPFWHTKLAKHCEEAAMESNCCNCQTMIGRQQHDDCPIAENPGPNF
jgi:hypothetical protein